MISKPATPRTNLKLRVIRCSPFSVLPLFNSQILMKRVTALAIADRAGNTFIFRYGVDAVDMRQAQSLHGAAGPVNLYLIDCVGVTQSKMDAHVIGREITPPAENIASLTHAVCGDVDGCTNRVAGAFGAADELHLDPMMMVGIHVAQQHRTAVRTVDDHVDLAVVEEVPKCRAATDGDGGESCSLGRGHKFEFAVSGIVKEQRALRIALSPFRMLIDLGINVAVDDEQILPAIIVVIKESVAKFHKGDGRLGNPGLIAYVDEGPSAIVPEEYRVVVGEGCAHD